MSVSRTNNNLSNKLRNGQLVKHPIKLRDNTKSERYGHYDASRDGIIYEGKCYKTLSGFAEQHYIDKRPDRKPSVNGWRECYTQTPDGWVIMRSLRQ